MALIDAIQSSATPLNASDDLQAVLDHLATGKPLDPELERRVNERAEKIRAEIRAKHGEINVAVEFREAPRRLMKYVLDASVALKWVLPEPDADKAGRLRDDFRSSIHELIAPDTFPVEVAHALTRAERRGIINKGDAEALLANVLTTAPRLHSYLALLRRAVVISSDVRIGVYDCHYVALAEKEKCELVTADDRLIKVLQPAFSFIISLASMP